LIALFTLFLAPGAHAQTGQAGTYQGPNLAAQRAAMDRLAPLVGAWDGPAAVTFPGPSTAHQTERVERELDGLLLVVRGAGYVTAERTGATVFAAFAVISFNERTNAYEVRSYNAGYSVTAAGEFLADGAFRWSFAAGGPVQMRFTIRIDGDSWREIGEMSRDGGATWIEMVSLDLRRG
jgi:hypothetical protein